MYFKKFLVLINASFVVFYQKYNFFNFLFKITFLFQLFNSVNIDIKMYF